MWSCRRRRDCTDRLAPVSAPLARALGAPKPASMPATVPVSIRAVTTLIAGKRCAPTRGRRGKAGHAHLKASAAWPEEALCGWGAAGGGCAGDVAPGMPWRRDRLPSRGHGLPRARSLQALSPHRHRSTAGRHCSGAEDAPLHWAARTGAPARAVSPGPPGSVTVPAYPEHARKHFMLFMSGSDVKPMPIIWARSRLESVRVNEGITRGSRSASGNSATPASSGGGHPPTPLRRYPAPPCCWCACCRCPPGTLSGRRSSAPVMVKNTVRTPRISTARIVI